MAELSIRPARRGDLPALAALERECFDDPWSPGLLARELDQPGSLFVVLAGGGTPVAHAVFRSVTDEAELLRLAVAPAERHQGHARALLAYGLERLAAAGVAACFLEVRPENRAARALYESEGFRLAGRRPRYYRDGADALLYRRALGSP